MSRITRKCTLAMPVQPIEEKELTKIMEKILDGVFGDTFDYLNLFVDGFSVELDWTTEEEEALFNTITRLYPKTLFVLDSDDEEGDHFRAYYKNGKRAAVEGVVIYPPFDESLLNDVSCSLELEWESKWVKAYRTAPIADLFELRDSRGILIGVLDTQEMEKLKADAQSANGLADILEEMGYLTGLRGTTFTEYFDRVLMSDEESYPHCQDILKLLPDQYKRLVVELRDDVCVIGENIYQLR